jgi:hypothetical protein
LSAPVATRSSAPTTRLAGFLAEFETPGDILAAAAKVRDAGYTRWDTHTPFAVHGLDKAMGIKGTRLAWIVMGSGTFGCAAGLGLQWWTNAVNYPFVISGKPFFSIPANIPVTFEITVLFSALAAFLCVVLLNGFPRWHHPVFSSERFRRATSDRFFVSIEAEDPLFDEAKTPAFLRGLGGASVERLEV